MSFPVDGLHNINVARGANASPEWVAVVARIFSLFACCRQARHSNAVIEFFRRW